jgi:hypothetical protein
MIAFILVISLLLLSYSLSAFFRKQSEKKFLNELQNKLIFNSLTTRELEILEEMGNALMEGFIPMENRLVAITDENGTHILQVTDENGNRLNPPLERN